MLRTLTCAIVYSGTAWVSFPLVRDALGHDLRSGGLALLLSAGLLAVLVRVATLAVVALRRPVAADLVERLHGEGRASLAPALGLAVAIAPLLSALTSRCGTALALRQWEAILLGLFGACALLAVTTALLEGLAALAGDRALAYLAATDPESWVFASDALAGARRQANGMLAGLARGTAGAGALVLLYWASSRGLGVPPAPALAGAVLAAVVLAGAMWRRKAASVQATRLAQLERDLCEGRGAHEWDGPTCTRCGARRHEPEGQLV